MAGSQLAGRAAVSAVSFVRASASPPPLREVLDVEADGSWRAWRSVGSAVGRFAAGNGGGAEVIAAVGAARTADPPAVPATGTLDDDATDEIDTGGTSFEVPMGAFPDGPWGAALVACRALLSAAPEHPLAAIVLAVDGPGAIRLEHRGSESLQVELGSAVIDTTAYDASGMPTAQASRALDLGSVEAGPGWSAEVNRVDPVGGNRLQVDVSFIAVDEGIYVPVTLSAAWPAG